MEEPAFILFDSYSRSSDIYQAVNEQGNFYSASGEKKELSEGIFQRIQEDLTEQIGQCTLYISTAKEVSSPDVQEIVDRKEYREELLQTKRYINFLYGILKEKEYTDIEGIYCFID